MSGSFSESDIETVIKLTNLQTRLTDLKQHSQLLEKKIKLINKVNVDATDIFQAVKTMAKEKRLQLLEVKLDSINNTITTLTNNEAELIGILRENNISIDAFKPRRVGVKVTPSLQTQLEMGVGVANHMSFPQQTPVYNFPKPATNKPVRTRTQPPALSMRRH